MSDPDKPTLTVPQFEAWLAIFALRGEKGPPLRFEDLLTSYLIEQIMSQTGRSAQIGFASVVLGDPWHLKVHVKCEPVTLRGRITKDSGWAVHYWIYECAEWLPLWHVFRALPSTLRFERPRVRADW